MVKEFLTRKVTVYSFSCNVELFKHRVLASKLEIEKMRQGARLNYSGIDNGQ